MIVSRQMRRRRLLIAAIAVSLALVYVRIQHVRIGWGEYRSVDFAPPWRR
jgi:hypothetical protein